MLTLIGMTLSVTLLIPQSGAAPAQSDPRERLETAIEEGIRLLEKKEYLKFLTTLADPAALAKRRDTPEEFAAEFAEDGAERLLAMLKRIRTAKPAMSADGNTATYQLDPAPERGPRTLRWEKIGKYWYIAN
jgi:hypothetical protein